MSGDKFCPDPAHWELLRKLHEVHGVQLDMLASVARVDIDLLLEQSRQQEWQLASGSDADRNANDPDETGKLRQTNARTAKRISTFLRKMLREQTAQHTTEGGIADAPTVTKNVLAIAKGVMTIEEMITNLDKLTNASGKYPQDALAFHRKLEKQIEAIADGSPA